MDLRRAHNVTNSTLDDDYVDGSDDYYSSNFTIPTSFDRPAQYTVLSLPGNQTVVFTDISEQELMQNFDQFLALTSTPSSFPSQQQLQSGNPTGLPSSLPVPPPTSKPSDKKVPTGVPSAMVDTFPPTIGQTQGTTPVVTVAETSNSPSYQPSVAATTNRPSTLAPSTHQPSADVKTFSPTIEGTAGNTPNQTVNGSDLVYPSPFPSPATGTFSPSPYLRQPSMQPTISGSDNSTFTDGKSNSGSGYKPITGHVAGDAVAGLVVAGIVVRGVMSLFRAVDHYLRPNRDVVPGDNNNNIAPGSMRSDGSDSKVKVSPGKEKGGR